MIVYHRRNVSFMCPMVLSFGFAIWKNANGSNLAGNNHECVIKVNKLCKRVSQYLAITKKLGNYPNRCLELQVLK